VLQTSETKRRGWTAMDGRFVTK